MDHYVKIYRYPRKFVPPIIEGFPSEPDPPKEFEPIDPSPFEKVVEDFEKGIEQAGINQEINNYCIGVINVSKIETISYEKTLESAEFCCPPQTATTNIYTVVGSYINTSNDVDFSIAINSFSTRSENGPAGPIEDPRNEGVFAQFPTEAQQENIMGVLINGITKAMQRTYDSTTQGVVDYYPPFDLGSASNMVSQVNPFQQGNSELPPDFEKELIEKELFAEPS